MADIVLTGDTSGAITVAAPAVAGTNTLTLPASTGTVLTDTAPKAGNVLQVVSTNKTDTFTSSTISAYTDIPGMSVSITPSSASSKIIIIVSMFGVFWQTGNNACILNLLRNSTAIGGGVPAGSRASVIGTQGMTNQSSGTKLDSGVQYHVTYVDSPSTTSATTYKMQFFQDTAGNPIYVNRTNNDANALIWARTSSSIIAMEVAG